MKHPSIRTAVLDALKLSVAEAVTWCDGRPALLEPEDLPAVAVFLTDAQATSESLDEDVWSATLHIEVFLKAAETDSALDKWMEEKIYPARGAIPALSGLVETMSAQGYDYQRDDEMAAWGSADLQYSIAYLM